MNKYLKNLLLALLGKDSVDGILKDILTKLKELQDLADRKQEECDTCINLADKYTQQADAATKERTKALAVAAKITDLTSVE